MSRSSFFLGITLLVLVALGCNNISGDMSIPFAQKNQYERVVANNHTYMLFAPSHWDKQDYGAPGYLTLERPYSNKQIDKYREKLTVSQVQGQQNINQPVANKGKKEISLGDFTQSHTRKLKSVLDDFKVLEHGETMINGYRAKRFVYAYKNKNEYNGTLKAIMYIFAKDGQFYIINGVDAREDFKNTREVFNKVVNSFNFI